MPPHMERDEAMRLRPYTSLRNQAQQEFLCIHPPGTVPSVASQCRKPALDRAAIDRKPFSGHVDHSCATESTGSGAGGKRNQNPAFAATDRSQQLTKGALGL